MDQKIIGLDETGIFEINDDKLRMIGGFVKMTPYPEREEQRLEAFFRNLCTKINNEKGWVDSDYELIYPYSLHIGAANIFAKVREDGSLAEMNKDTRGNIKYRYGSQRSEITEWILSETLEYMKQNNYQLYALVDQPGEAEAADQSNVVDFEVAGNRYERLAILALYNNIFYQPDASAVEKVHLHLATRTLRVEEDEVAAAAEQLYDQRTSVVRGVRFYANTTTSTFKTALADKLYESGHLVGSMDFAFHVNQANYKMVNQPRQPFLYLADIACAYLRQEFLQKTPLQVREECALPISIWMYGEADRQWRRALEQYLAGDLSQSFTMLYDLNQGNTEAHDYYRKFWGPMLEARALRDLEAGDAAGQARRRAAFARMQVFLSEIEQDMMSNRQERGYYLARQMKGILDRIMKAEPRYIPEGKRYLFRVNDQLLRGLNHRGAVSGMREYIDECDRYRTSIQMEDYIYHIIRVIQYYFNSYQFEKAVEVATLLDETAAKMMDTYQEYAKAGVAISGEILGAAAPKRRKETVRFLAAGRLHSTLGQAYAFLGRYGHAKKYFSMAQQEFGEGENYRITLCHELQLYIDQKKQTEYERASREYFGTENLWEQWHKAVDGLPGSVYSLQAFVKAFRVFYADDRSNEYLVKEMVAQLTANGGGKGHPWQIIYKNLYEIVCMTGLCKDQRNWLRDKMFVSTQPEPCMEIMVGYYRILVALEEKGDVNKAIENFRDVVQQYGLEESFPVLMALDPVADRRSICNYLLKKIRYEYV